MIHIDNFDDGIRNPVWTDEPNNGSIVEAGNVLTIAIADGIDGRFWETNKNGPVCYIDSTSTIILTTKINNFTLNNNTRTGFYITNSVDGNHGIFFGKVRKDSDGLNGLEALKFITGQLAYSAVASLPVWLKISANNSGLDSIMKFYYSTDGETWNYLYEMTGEIWQYAGLIAFNEIDEGWKNEALTDGGMEIWTSPTNLTNWTEFGSPQEVHREAVIVHGGTYSCRLYTFKGGDFTGIYQNFTLIPDDLYKLDLWYIRPSAASGSNLRVYVMAVGSPNYYLKSDGTWTTASALIFLPAANDWTKYELEFMAKTGYVNYQIKFYKDHSSGGSSNFYIDDISILNWQSKYNAISAPFKFFEWHEPETPIGKTAPEMLEAMPPEAIIVPAPEAMPPEVAAKKGYDVTVYILNVHLN